MNNVQGEYKIKKIDCLTTAPYALTIKNNMSAVSQLKVECSGIYVDLDTGLETPVKSVISFTRTENAGQFYQYG